MTVTGKTANTQGVNSAVASICVALILVLAPAYAMAAAGGHAHGSRHGDELYHSLEFMADYGRTDAGDNFSTSHYKGWLGNSTHKFFVQGEIERHDNATERTEFWFMYSRRVTEFWDIQAGVRHDSQPDSRGYLLFGLHGEARFFIETSLHGALGEDGDINIRLHQYRDLLISNELVLTPYLEINVSSKDVPTHGIASGLARTELGLRLRYSITPKFSPYLDLLYEHDNGDIETADGHGGDDDFWALTVGIRLLL